MWGYLTYSRSISCAAKQANFAVTSAATGPTTIAWAHRAFRLPLPGPGSGWDRRRRRHRRHGEVCEYFLRWLHAFLAIINSIGAVGQIQSKNVNTWYNFYMVFSSNTLYICLLWVYSSCEQYRWCCQRLMRRGCRLINERGLRWVSYDCYRSYFV